MQPSAYLRRPRHLEQRHALESPCFFQALICQNDVFLLMLNESLGFDVKSFESCRTPGIRFACSYRSEPDYLVRYPTTTTVRTRIPDTDMGLYRCYTTARNTAPLRTVPQTAVHVLTCTCSLPSGRFVACFLTMGYYGGP